MRRGGGGHSNARTRKKVAGGGALIPEPGSNTRTRNRVPETGHPEQAAAAIANAAWRGEALLYPNPSLIPEPETNTRTRV